MKNSEVSNLTHSVDACPGCGGTSARSIGTAGASFSIVVEGQTYMQPAYQPLECPNCGLLYKSEVLSDEALAEYYSRVDFRRWEISGLNPPERLVRRELLNLPAGARILDVGCSSGRLLASLPSGSLLFGIEPNAAAAAEAAAKGIAMLPSDSASSDFFDVIILMDVFEHLTEPFKTLADLVQRIKPGGRLIIATGNGDHPLCRKSPAEFWYFRNVEHLCMLTRNFASHLARHLPLQPTGWHLVRHYDSPMVERFVRWLRLFTFRQAEAKTLLWRGLLRHLPKIERAGKWRECPSYELGRDHVVAVFARN